MELTSQKLSFMPIPLQTVQLTNLDLLQPECKKIVTAGQTVDISDIDQQFLATPYFLRLFFSLYYTLANRTRSHRYPTNQQADSFSYFNTNIKSTIFKQIGTLIQKKLFTSSQFQKFYEEVSYSLAFKSSLMPYFISLLSENTNFIAIQRLTSFYRTICSEQYLLYIPIQLYYLYGGSLFTIQSKQFKQKAINLIQSLGRVLANSETIINRNIQQFKNNKERKLVLDESLKVVMLSKNKESLVEIIQNMTRSIFSGREYLNKEEFLYQIQSKPIDPLISILILFLRSEYVMFQERVFQNALTIRSQTSSSNFYTNQMNKLLNKCPFNGDERCNCKKCQCVRRNRQSAKLNQQKKRNAVQQVDVFKKRVQQLQEKEKKFQKQNAELREQNLMLKTLLKEIRLNPSMKSIMMEAIEPINKVLNNDL